MPPALQSLQSAETGANQLIANLVILQLTSTDVEPGTSRSLIVTCVQLPLGCSDLVRVYNPWDLPSVRYSPHYVHIVLHPCFGAYGCRFCAIDAISIDEINRMLPHQLTLLLLASIVKELSKLTRSIKLLTSVRGADFFESIFRIGC